MDGRTAAGLLPGLTGNPTKLAWLVSGLLALMYLLYLGAVATAPRLRARWTIAAVLAIHVIFLLAPPLSYTDVFNYVNYGRMGVVHHLNPYVLHRRLSRTAIRATRSATGITSAARTARCSRWSATRSCRSG